MLLQFADEVCQIKLIRRKSILDFRIVYNSVQKSNHIYKTEEIMTDKREIYFLSASYLNEIGVWCKDFELQ